MKLPAVKRLAADILRCGRNKVWLDPSEGARLKSSSSRMQIRNLIKDGMILKKPNVVHSRWRANKRAEAKRKGRHTGLGSRRGTKNARMPEKRRWISRIRKQRAALKEMKKNAYVTPEEYRQYYLQAKGNSFKSLGVMESHIEKKRIEKLRIQELASQAAALRMKK